MASRNPSAFTQFIDLLAFRTGKAITDVEMDKFIDDMHWAWLAEQMIISDNFAPIKVSSTSYFEIAEYKIDCKDTLSNFTSTTADWSLYGWTDNSINLDIEVATAWDVSTDTSTHSITATATPTWSTFNDTVLVGGDNDETTITVSVKASAAGDVYVAGFFLSAL